MADVVHPIGILTQIRAVAGLRWRILRNGWRKESQRLHVLGMILLGILSGIFVLGLCVTFFAGAYAFLSEGRPVLIGLLFWGVFIFWQLFPIFAAGFGASFEFRSMLRFPMNLPAFYIIGLAYGLADFSAVASVCWLASMTLGVAAARPGVLPAMLPVVAVFLLFNVTLERLVGSWLERLLSRRRTRELYLSGKLTKRGPRTRGATATRIIVARHLASSLLGLARHQARGWLKRFLPPTA